MIYAVLILIIAIVAVSWLGIRRSERFNRWMSRRLAREQAGLDPAIDQGFARKLDQDARDKGAV